MSDIRGVILDIDGTLVDSNDAHAWAWRLALLEAGLDIPLARIRVRIGKGGDKLLPEVSGLSEETPEGKRISQRRGEIFRERYLPRLAPFPRTRDLLERMRASGLKLVVASSAKQEELEPLLERAGAADLVAHATSSDDAENSKPDPDIVHAALGRSGLAASTSTTTPPTCSPATTPPPSPAGGPEPPGPLRQRPSFNGRLSSGSGNPP